MKTNENRCPEHVSITWSPALLAGDTRGRDRDQVCGHICKSGGRADKLPASLPSTTDDPQASDPCRPFCQTSLLPPLPKHHPSSHSRGPNQQKTLMEETLQMFIYTTTTTPFIKLVFLIKSPQEMCFESVQETTTRCRHDNIVLLLVVITSILLDLPLVLKPLSGGRPLIVLKLLALDLECLLVSLLHSQSFSQITNNIDALNLCDSFL